MKYLYPKLSDKDLGLFRLGGAGLGNILFTYARAMVYSKKHTDCKLIWLTWPSLKIGTILRNETDKRFYNDLFVNNSGYVNGVKKLFLLLSKKHISEQDLLKGDIVGAETDCIVDFTGFENCFTDIIEDSQIVKEDIIKNLNPKQKNALCFDGEKSICMHVRLGDFTRATKEDVKSGKHNVSLPIDWYVKMGNDLRYVLGKDVKIYIFSDGKDEELAPLLALPNAERFTTGSAIGDILALSSAGILVASGSSFSMWARYLGRMTTVMFPNQVKQKILLDSEPSKEIVALEDIPPEFYDVIKSALM